MEVQAEVAGHRLSSAVEAVLVVVVVEALHLLLLAEVVAEDRLNCFIKTISAIEASLPVTGGSPPVMGAEAASLGAGKVHSVAEGSGFLGSDICKQLRMRRSNDYGLHVRGASWLRPGTLEASGSTLTATLPPPA